LIYNDILYDVRERIAWIKLNRPEKLNALSLGMQRELSEAFWAADSDPEVRVIVLAAEGRAFCAGYDLTGNRNHGESPYGGRTNRTFDDDVWRLETSQRLRMAIFDMHKPVIAMVHGYCLAGGTDLALLCDIVIAAQDASFGFPAARAMGALPNHMWLYLCGPQWAKRLLMTGDTITGSEAQQIGLVAKAVPTEFLESEVSGLASRLALIDAELLTANKRIVNLGLELMGARTLQRLAAENDARAHLAPSAAEFGRIAGTEGLKAALHWRDSKFGDGRARVNGPESRDANGHLIGEE
jgi:enoyl-CoA hydratase